MNHICKNIQGWCNFYDLYNSIIDRLPQNFFFAEVGVWKGHSLAYFTVECINKNKQGTIYAIDHWKGSAEHHNPSDPSYEPILANNPDGLYHHFLENIKPIQEYITVMRQSSEEASKVIPNGSLDAIFIDASHEYDDVLHDLSLWISKIKNNGIFCGHDYDWLSVRTAVQDFAKINNLKVYPTSSSCWLLK
jgi:hypothetical protein